MTRWLGSVGVLLFATTLGFPEDGSKAAAAEKSAALSAATKPDALYLLACARAQQGKKTEAIAALEQSVAAGFTMKRMIERDPDFEPLRGETRFKALIAKL